MRRRADRRETQYFEMFVNRGIYHKGWTAVTRHSIPWVATPMPAFDDDVWELYGPDDWTQARDLAAEQPDKLRDLQRLFLIEATKYDVLPLDDRRFERFNPDLAGRPQLVKGDRQVLFGGMGRLSENSVIVIKNKSHSITAQISVPDGGASGVHRRAGRCLRRLQPLPPRGQAGVLLQPLRPRALQGLRRRRRPGRATTRSGWSSRTTAVASARVGRASLFVDGAKVGEGRVERTVPMLFSADETTDVGSDSATPVSDDYDMRTGRFTGRIEWVELAIDEAAEDLDHLITPEERLRVAMARQ